MFLRAVSFAALLTLGFTAMPLTAQEPRRVVTIHVQETAGSAWKQVDSLPILRVKPDETPIRPGSSELLSRANQRCSPRESDPVPARHSVKLVLPSGQEEVIDCAALWESQTMPPAQTQEGQRFINGGCANNRFS